MFETEEIFGFGIVIVLLFYGHQILQFLMLLYFKFKFYESKPILAKDIAPSVLEIVAPYERFLFAKGFVRKMIIEHDDMIVGRELVYYKFYYYQPQEGVHAFVETQPFTGALERVKLTYESLYESKHICVTVNAAKHHFPALPDEVYLFDHYLSSQEEVYQSHLKDREIEAEKLLKEPFDQEGLLAYDAYMQRAYVESFVKAGIVKYTTYGYRFIASFKVWNYAKDMIDGYKKAKKILKEKLEESKENDESHIQGLLHQLDAMEKPKGESNRVLWLIGSMLAFTFLFGLFGFDFIDIIILILVLFIHEAGHYLAMRYFGYRDTSIFFMPFGAITVGKKEKRSAWEEYVVAMAGPLPGLILGIVLLILVTQYQVEFLNSSFLNTFAMMSIVINYLNLLPIYPLDGGRIMQTLLLLKYPKGQFYFYLLSLSVLLLAMVYFKDYLLLILVVILLFGLKQNYAISRLLKELQKSNHRDEITKEIVAKVVVEDEKYAKVSFSNKANLIKQALMVLHTGEPSKKLLFFGFGFYMILLLPAVILLGLSSFASLSSLTNEEQQFLQNFEKNIIQYKVLTVADDQVNYSLEESLKTIDDYLVKYDLNRTIGKPVDEDMLTNPVGCTIPKEIKSIFYWHNGVEQLMPYYDFLNIKSLRKTYKEEQKIVESMYGLVPFVIDGDFYGYAYSCKDEGIYDYPPYAGERGVRKHYYNINHYFKVIAEAYEQKAFYVKNHLFMEDRKKFEEIYRAYLSAVDKKRYENYLNYLKHMAYLYQQHKSLYIKQRLLYEMELANDPTLLPSVVLYLNDKDKFIAKRAAKIVENLKEKGN